jgi:DNA-directed RNA polymerase specialized sigma24 family protein
VFRQYFIEEHALEKWAKNQTSKQADKQVGSGTPGSLGLALNADVLTAMDQLPAKQQEVLLDYVNQDVSFSELARQRNVPLTSVTSMVKAALINIEKALNPFALNHWLSEQLQVTVTPQDLVTTLSAPAEKLLMLLAKKDLHLAATVIDMPKDLPAPQKLKRLNELLEPAWQDLTPEIQRLIDTMARGDYEISALQGASQKTEAKFIYRDKVSPAINTVFKKVGAAPLGTLLRLRGFDYMTQSDRFESLTPEAKNILAYCLSEGRDLKPLARRIQGIALGEQDALHWLQREVDRGFAELTPYQQEIWQHFCENTYNAAEVARKRGKSQKAVGAALRLMLNKLDVVWQTDGVLMALNRQGLLELRTPEQLAVLGTPIQVVLREYFAKGYSLEPLLQEPLLPNQPPIKHLQSVEQQLMAVKQAVEKAMKRLQSELQQNTLNAYASGLYPNYEAIAQAVGLRPQDRNRIGGTLDAALKNLRAVLENSPKTVLNSSDSK